MLLCDGSSGGSGNGGREIWVDGTPPGLGRCASERALTGYRRRRRAVPRFWTARGRGEGLDWIGAGGSGVGRGLLGLASLRFGLGGMTGRGGVGGWGGDEGPAC